VTSPFLLAGARWLFSSTMTPVPDALQAALSGRYEFERELGSGGMATVYLARDARHARQVAIKVLHGATATTPTQVERFLREIQIAARLVHPNIVPLHDSGEADGVLFYVMPYLASETLAARLERAGPLESDQARRVAIVVARALDYAHRQGVVHRDIKPSNIFLHEGEALLADFGVARAVFSLGAASFATTVGFTVGTPHYMSPEQAAGDPALDHRSDQYSLACVLYEMLAGQPPFASAQQSQAIMRRFVETAPRIRTLRPGVPAAIDVALARALERDPAARFESAAQFAEALEAGSARQVDAPVGAACSVAVLPFATVGGDADTEYLADGLTDELISALTRVDGLRVASRTSAFAYKGQAVDVRRVGKDLDVDYVIEGSVRRAGPQLRVTARLTNAADGRSREALRFDRAADDVLALEDELARAIVRSLRPKLVDNVSLRPLARTQHPGAYRLYLKGRFAWNKRTFEDTADAIRYFHDAIELDPHYAMAYSGLADAYALQLDYRSVPVAEGMARAKAYALKALELDAGLAEAHASLGWVLFIHDWKWDESLRHFERAVELSPRYATGHQWHAMPLSALGRFDMARVEAQAAVELDPASVSARRGRAWAAYYGRRFDDAILHAERALEMNPTSEESHRLLGFALLASGDAERSLQAFQEGLLQTPDVPYSMAGSAGALQRLGRLDEARAVRAALEDRATREYVSSAAMVMLHAGIGNVDRALDWLEKAHAERRGFVAYSAVHPLLDPLRDSPRFDALLRALHLQHVRRPA
jgi:eukaryotic-like serine/threonine-protein kinase